MTLYSVDDSTDDDLYYIMSKRLELIITIINNLINHNLPG